MILFSPTKKIYRDDFRKVLRSIPQLSPQERTYVEGIFQHSLRDGLTKTELKREISQLKHNPNDPLDSFEVRKLKEKLMESL